jgi:photosystem II stability/assembly factor-like uncharacterized protein
MYFTDDHLAFKSEDAGLSWRWLPVTNTVRVPGTYDSTQMSAHLQRAHLLYADAGGGYLSRSDDYGATWQATGAYVPGSVAQMAFVPGAEETLYLLSKQGQVYYATAHTWEARGKIDASAVDGFSMDSFSILKIDARDPRRLYLSKHSLVYASEDGGNSWQTLPRLPLCEIGQNDCYIIKSLALSADGRLLAHAEPMFSLFSFEADRQWRALSQFPAANALFSNDDGVLYAYRSQFEGNYAVSVPLFKSEDSGETWQEQANLSAAFPTYQSTTDIGIAIHPQRPDTLYALYAFSSTTESNIALMESHDSGQTWQRIESADTTTSVLGADTYAIFYLGMFNAAISAQATVLYFRNYLQNLYRIALTP